MAWTELVIYKAACDVVCKPLFHLAPLPVHADEGHARAEWPPFGGGAALVTGLDAGVRPRLSGLGRSGSRGGGGCDGGRGGGGDAGPTIDEVD